MIRSACAPIAIAFISAVATMAPSLTRAAIPGALPPPAPVTTTAVAASEDDPEEASPLVVMEDFDRDGIADMAKAVAPAGNPSGPSTLTVMLGQKDGTFLPVDSKPAIGHDPRSFAVGDFNHDGNPDLIVGDGDGSLIVLLGDGKGNLVPTPDSLRVTSVASIAMGDFNHDGNLDLAVSDPKSNTVTILLGSGNGDFRPAWSFKLPMQGAVFHLAVADFNGDGIPDLAVTSEDQETFEVMLGNGNGTFTSAPDLSHLRDPNAHCVT
jgi:VCBS repeat protein